MQYSTLFLAAISATGTFALPAGRPRQASGYDTSLRVELKGPSELATQNNFIDGQEDIQTPASFGPFETVELTVGADVEKQDYRCEIRNEMNQLITVLRGENRDVSFADGDKGEWTLSPPSKVSSIRCDPKITKGQAPETRSESVNIRLSGDNELAVNVNIDLVNGDGSEVPPASGSPFNTVELTAEGAQRCQLIGPDGQPILLQRGENIDTTFADGGKGPWSFVDPEESGVSRVDCKKEFKADPQPNTREGDLTSVNIRLSGDDELAVNVQLDVPASGGVSATPPASGSIFNSVELTSENDKLRCQLTDQNGNVILLQRGDNKEPTFADGSKGPWSFLDPTESKVGRVTCNFAFTKGFQS